MDRVMSSEISNRLFLSLALAMLFVGIPLGAQQRGYQVVVSASNPVSTLSKAEVGRLFLKKSTQWEHGANVMVVDQTADASVRKAFTRGVHGKAVSHIKSYWQRLIFSGRETPPAELRSDRDVLEFVRDKKGGIGYVSAGTPLGRGVKVLRVTE